ncbi:MAG: PL29 family lyase N-terminal domain-containing protein, partial [Prevotellaceae bacterium]|nr:PL29 family lyase N-terminal domain-containing protein [Prevotellaceae bacterium]
MKRKLFSALLFGACLMASTSTFVSCKDYDDDIQNLQTQIDANSKAIAEIQKLIQSGSVITNVSSTANGVTVTLSNGNTFNVTNGKDGA